MSEIFMRCNETVYVKEYIQIDRLQSALTTMEMEMLKILNSICIANTKRMRDALIITLAKRKRITAEKIMPNEITILEKSLRKLNIKVPSYQTVDKMMQSLDRLGIVGQRITDNKKTKYLWIISPNFERLMTANKRKLQKTDIEPYDLRFFA